MVTAWGTFRGEIEDRMVAMAGRMTPGAESHAVPARPGKAGKLPW
jgi:hypothetical protein